MFNAFLKALSRFRKDERGIVLILFTLLIFPLMLVVAVVVDFSQTLVMKRQLTTAVDAAALALGTLPSLEDDEAEAKAAAYIAAQYPDSAVGRITSTTLERSDDAIDLTVSAVLDTTFLRIAGVDTLSVTVTNRVVRRQNRLEIVMALDNTGSMGGAKLIAMKNAATTMVDTLFGDDEESPAVRIGLVPFTGAVNLGPGVRGAPWLDESNPSALNFEQIDNDGSFTSLFNLFDQLEVPWKGCIRARTENFDATDEPPNPANSDTLFTAFFAPDELAGNNNNYINGDTQKKKNSNHYKNNKGQFSSSGPNTGCPDSAVLPLTNVKTTILGAINSMRADGFTVIPEGAAWAWRLISPGEPFATGAPYSDQETIKAVIILTDGENQVQPGGNGEYKSLFTAYGYAGDGLHLGPADGSQANVVLNQKTTAVCNNIKADKDGDTADQDVVVYTIGFAVTPGSQIDTLMRNCATDETKYFNSPNASDLEAVFEAIAIGLNKLRVAS